MNNSKKLTEQAHFFENRLIKRNKHLKKWSKRSAVFCYRLYDKDIPEIPLAVDVHTDFSAELSLGSGLDEIENKSRRYVVIYLYKRPYQKSENDEMLWLKTMASVVAKVLDVSSKNIFTKVRQKQSGKNQYEKRSFKSKTIIAKEGDALFYLNLSDYLDTGLFLDHRITRLNINKIAENKTVLNLFCYTGAFSVHSALGGAKSVTSVDLSKTYLQWAKNNFTLNNIALENHEFVNSDVFEFLQAVKNSPKKWDIIICDPPTFSNSKKTETVLEINNDWLSLISECVSVLNHDGELYFSSNSRKLQINSQVIINEALKKTNNAVIVKEITTQSIDEDFRNSKPHRLWKVVFGKVD